MKRQTEDIDPHEADASIQPVEAGEEGTSGASADADVTSEHVLAQRLARRLGLEYVELSDFQIDHELFRAIPVDLMFRYNFVPYERRGKALAVVVSDPTDILMIDELESLLAQPSDVTVGTRSAIQEILKKSESSQRV